MPLWRNFPAPCFRPNHDSRMGNILSGSTLSHHQGPIIPARPMFSHFNPLDYQVTG